MNRHESRIIIVAALYNIEINYHSPEDVILFLETLLHEVKLPEMKLLEVTEDDKVSIDPFVNETIKGILAKQASIDEVISQNLINWTLSGLSYVDRAIIRLATYEMLYSDTPPSIIINEAIELTKEYSDLDDGNQARFNNRVLDNIKESIINARK